MKVTLIGLQQSGKSTILSAISGKEIAAMVSTEVHEQIVSVPDDRLEWLAGLYHPKKIVRATVDCLDLPGLSFVDEHGRAAARRMFGNVRTADLFVIVVRAFESDSVAKYRDRIDPARDLDELRTEFLLADLELVMTRIEKLEKQVHKPTKTQVQDKAELDLQLRLQKALESEQPISTVVKTPHEQEIVKPLGFLTLKPMMVVVNVGENQLDKTFDLSKSAPAGVEVLQLCASIEYELAKLDADSRKEFMADMGLKEPASIKFVQSCYKTLGLISFLTAGEDEVRAWPIAVNTTAHDAAGKIHSDIKRGFIRAETMSYADIKALGDEKAVKAAGKVRLEGKTYIVQDGDIINFRFNV
jgi:ribosome-binding ATPase